MFVPDWVDANATERRPRSACSGCHEPRPTRLPAARSRASIKWFLLLIKEAGMAITATEAALMLVFCGVVVGSAMFVWNEHPASAVVGLLMGMTAALGY